MNNNKWWILSFLLIFFSWGLSQQTIAIQKGVQLTLKDSLYLKPQPGNPRTSEGDFLILKNKHILTVYTQFTEGVSDNSRASLIGRVSTDNGSTWGDERVIVENEGAQNVMSVSLLRLKNKKIALFYLVKNSDRDCYPVMRISTNEGKTWSDPNPCIPPGTGYFVLNNNRVIQLKSGRILVPVAHHQFINSEFQQDAVISCRYSDDQGATWHTSGKVTGPKGVIKQEPGLIELKDGKVLMYIRTGSGFQYFSYSTDRGLNWSDAQQGNLVSARSPALIIRDPYTQALVTVWNDHPSERAPLSLAVSFDEGQTWEQQVTLPNDPTLWHCYPALEVVAPNTFLLSFCFGDKKVWGLEGMMIYKLNYPFQTKR